MRKLTTTLVCAFAVLAFAAGVWAKNEEAVDWDEAIEFAEVTDTYVENGVKWVTWFDELQGAMWSQPADAPAEAVKAYLSGDQEELEGMGLDWLCVVRWPTPYYLRLADDGGVREVYPDDFVYYGPGQEGAAYHRIWEGWDIAASFEADTSLYSVVFNSSDYTEDYNGRYYKQPTGQFLTGCDTEDVIPQSGYYYYRVFEEGDVENYFYEYDTCTPVAKHEIYACDFTRVVQIRYCLEYPE